MNKFRIVPAALAALSGWSPSSAQSAAAQPAATPPTSAPAPAPAAPAAAAAAVDVEGLTPLAGSWSYRSFPGGSEASFADGGGVRRLQVRCNRVARIVSVVRSGVPAATATLSIWTSSAARAVPARFDPAQTLTADLAASDRLLDAIAFSRGRFATSATGAPLAAVPAWAESARVIEDCRT